jgi:hypothetical protein
VLRRFVILLFLAFLSRSSVVNFSAQLRVSFVKDVPPSPTPVHLDLFSCDPGNRRLNKPTLKVRHSEQRFRILLNHAYNC